jgi:hypothetical protein
LSTPPVDNAIMVTYVILLTCLLQDQRQIVAIIYEKRLVSSRLLEKVVIPIHTRGLDVWARCCIIFQDELFCTVNGAYFAG